MTLDFEALANGNPEALAALSKLREKIQKAIDVASSSETIAYLDSINELADQFSTASAPLFVDPLSSTTKQAQDRLLIASALLIVTSIGIGHPTELTLGPMKFSGLLQSGALVSVIASVVYFLLVYLLERTKDVRKYQASQMLAYLQIEAVRERSYNLFAGALRAHVAASDLVLKEIESARSLSRNAAKQAKDMEQVLDAGHQLSEELVASVINTGKLISTSVSVPSLALDELKSADSSREIIETRLNAIFGALESLRTTIRYRAITDLILPVIVAIMALAIGFLGIYSYSSSRATPNPSLNRRQTTASGLSPALASSKILAPICNLIR